MQITSNEIECLYRHLNIRARKYGLNEADREDLVSESFYKGYKKIDTFVCRDENNDGRIRSLKAWFGTIMNNTFKDKIKSADVQKVDRNIDIELSPPKSESLGPEKMTAKELALDKFWEIFDQLLKTREKEIMLMNMEGDKYFEIADALGMSINTVGSKINSAKNKLKDRLTDLEPIYLELIGT